MIRIYLSLAQRNALEVFRPSHFAGELHQARHGIDAGRQDEYERRQTDGVVVRLVDVERRRVNELLTEFQCDESLQGRYDLIRSDRAHHEDPLEVVQPVVPRLREFRTLDIR